MFSYVKKLQYPVNIKHCDPAAASIIISQYGGPDGELEHRLDIFHSVIPCRFRNLKVC